ncbi:hypothetical protein DIPPA_31153 [Diplonema papillatum]|nr:hypothetical protein DIPPA_31153 [Diplonema papillatum]|eukprot:gene9216-14286_t
MLKRCGPLLGYRAVATDMIRLWRQYGKRVGEVHANIENVHWSINDEMLASYLEQYAEVTDVKVIRDSENRRGVHDGTRKWGRSLGTATCIFKPGQEDRLKRFFTTRHVLNGRELIVDAPELQPQFNFYIPNTHEQDSEGMSPEVVQRMSSQVVDLSMTVTGRWSDSKAWKLQKLRDAARRTNPSPAPSDPDRPWFTELGDESWDNGEAEPEAAARGAPSQRRRQPFSTNQQSVANWLRDRQEAAKAGPAGDRVHDEEIPNTNYYRKAPLQ